MKLELKHIMPYANFGLEGKFCGKWDVLTEIDFENGIVSSLNNGNCLVKDFKPILQPLSKFQIEQFYDEDDTNYLLFTDDEDFLWLEDGSDGSLRDPHNAMACYTLLQTLFVGHYDIFRLIPAKLAIDINTLK